MASFILFYTNFDSHNRGKENYFQRWGAATKLLCMGFQMQVLIPQLYASSFSRSGSTYVGLGNIFVLGKFLWLDVFVRQSHSTLVLSCFRSWFSMDIVVYHPPLVICWYIYPFKIDLDNHFLVKYRVGPRSLSLSLSLFRLGPPTSNSWLPPK